MTAIFLNEEIQRKKVSEIESLCGHDVGRNIKRLVNNKLGNLFLAAKSIANHPFPRVAITTGFVVEDIAGMYVPETDGPLGAAHLAAALNNSGIEVVLITDDVCEKAVRAAVDVFNLNISVLVAGKTEEDVKKLKSRMFSGINAFTHIIAIERPDKTKDGSMRNMMGNEISSLMSPLWILFEKNKGDPSPDITIGIGDGGNEIGMGSVPFEIIASDIKNGAKIAATTPCDYTIVSGVSNWGGIALVAALSIVAKNKNKKISAFLDSSIDMKIMQAMLNNGFAVDGVSKLSEYSVDGIAFSEHIKFMEKIKYILRTKMEL